MGSFEVAFYPHQIPKTMKRFAVLTLIVLFFTGCSSNEGWTPSADEPRAFVTTLGADTVAVEVYTVTDNTIEGILVERAPYTHIFEYAATLNEKGNITSLSFTKRTPDANPAGPVVESTSISIENGTATISRTGGENAGTLQVDSVGMAIPTLGRAAVAMFEFEHVATLLQNGATEILLLGPNGAAPRANASIVISSDSVSMDYFGAPRKGWTDKNGLLLGVSGALTTGKSESRRVEPFLVGEMAERWAAMDVAGTGIGTPSPGAVVAVSLDGANLEINYSQPAKRGREIWGQLVPEGQFWRTGANAATHFSTSADLDLGGNLLPAGTYTLWSVYENGGLQFLVNSQTNQWGTVHDPALDLFAVDMTKSELAEMSERFTISIEDTPEGGSIHFDWDMTRFSLPFTVK